MFKNVEDIQNYFKSENKSNVKLFLDEEFDFISYSELVSTNSNLSEGILMKMFFKYKIFKKIKESNYDVNLLTNYSYKFLKGFDILGLTKEDLKTLIQGNIYSLNNKDTNKLFSNIVSQQAYGLSMKALTYYKCLNCKAEELHPDSLTPKLCQNCTKEYLELFNLGINKEIYK